MSYEYKPGEQCIYNVIAHKKPATIHYIGEEQNSRFIIAKTGCGKDWRDINEFTSNKADVTCKSCLRGI